MYIISSTILLILATGAARLTAAYPQASSSSPPVSEQPDYVNDTTFRNAMLGSTNAYRLQHNAQIVLWHPTLVNYAQGWTNQCRWAHSNPATGSYGENLATNTQTPAEAIRLWADEASLYNYTAGQFGHDTGHFTQLVWNATRFIGCGRTYCGGTSPDGTGRAWGWFVACEYYPRGNVQGAFISNVFPPSS